MNTTEMTVTRGGEIETHKGAAYLTKIELEGRTRRFHVNLCGLRFKLLASPDGYRWDDCYTHDDKQLGDDIITGLSKLGAL